MQDLAAHVDALADLQVAEAVSGLVRGRPATVAASTAAAAGTGRLTDLDVIRTPRIGRSVTSVVLVLLPPPTGSPGRPTEIADHAVAAFLDDHAGDPDGPDWAWNSPGNAPITLADVGLRPSDTLGLGADNLTQVIKDATGLTDVVPGPVPGHDRIRCWAAALAGKPGTPTDLAESSPAANAVAVSDMQARLAAVRLAAQDAIVELRAAAGDGSADVTLRTALILAARWGITPLAGSAGAPDDSGLPGRIRHAAEALSARLARAGDPAADTELAIGEAAEKISDLVVGEGAFPVFGRIDVQSRDRLIPDFADATLPPEWLETVAPVRSALARLEAVQLDEQLRKAGAPMLAWSSRPDDLWQQQTPTTSEGIPEATRLVTVFGPSGILPGSADSILAAAVIDRFVETIPHSEHTAALAFRHDLPNARGQNAVLLAVPPDLNIALTGETLINIVNETRLLAHARMADPAKLGAAAEVLHLATISAVGRTGVRLEGRP